MSEEDLTNIIGHFMEINLDCIDKQSQEIEQLEKENESLRRRIKTIKRRRKYQTRKKNKYKSLLIDRENVLTRKNKEKADLINWLESKNKFHYKNGKIEDNYILVSEVLNKVRGD